MGLVELTKVNAGQKCSVTTFLDFLLKFILIYMMEQFIHLFIYIVLYIKYVPLITYKSILCLSVSGGDQFRQLITIFKPT